jgi:hypothetical protein
MPVTERKPVCIAWLGSPFVSFPERALWNPRIFMEFGDYVPGISACPR